MEPLTAGLVKSDYPEMMLNSTVFQFCGARNNPVEILLFISDCPDQYSGKGRCVNGTCKCIEGWTGKSCDKGIP